MLALGLPAPSSTSPEFTIVSTSNIILELDKSLIASYNASIRYLSQSQFTPSMEPEGVCKIVYT